MQRRRRIRSGHFGSLRQTNSRKKEGLMTVRRYRICNLSGEMVSIALNLSYVIHRPDLIHSEDRKPLLVIHGGPSIPSDYLQPMAANFQDRCIIFYDQIGCGNSSIPSDMNQYSIQHSVDDLEQLIHHLKLKQFHLYGHSFGGIVAYEFSKRQRDSPNNKTDHADEMPQLLSMTLSSTPSNLRGVSEESQSLMETLRKRSNSDCNISSDYDSREERDHIEDPVSDLFKKTFVCRTTDGTIPQPLQEAFHKKGSVWEGSDVIIDYIAEPRHNSTSKMPRAMLMRGEHDFVSEKYGFHDWKNLINDNHIDYVTLSDCAHYSMLENASLHADVLNKFLNKCDKEDFNSQEVSQ